MRVIISGFEHLMERVIHAFSSITLTPALSIDCFKISKLLHNTSIADILRLHLTVMMVTIKQLGSEP